MKNGCQVSSFGCDEAYVVPTGSALRFGNGDVMVNLDLRMVGNNVEAAKVIAQKIAARL